MAGRQVTRPRLLARIRCLAIPPAWTEVWICPSDDGHIQATGRDTRGRKQYVYHPFWRAARDATKFDQLASFGARLPAIRRRVRRDLRRSGLPRERVLAAVVRLLDQTGARIGNEEYRRQNRSFGLTTLRQRHVRRRGPRLRLVFRGKSAVVHQVSLDDRRLARVVERCQDLPGQQLFQSVDDDGTRHGITSGDVNDYLRQIPRAGLSSTERSLLALLRRGKRRAPRPPG